MEEVNEDINNTMKTSITRMLQPSPSGSNARSNDFGPLSCGNSAFFASLYVATSFDLRGPVTMVTDAAGRHTCHEFGHFRPVSMVADICRPVTMVTDAAGRHIINPR